jgi:hypothetical protein
MQPVPNVREDCTKGCPSDVVEGKHYERIPTSLPRPAVVNEESRRDLTNIVAVCHDGMNSSTQSPSICYPLIQRQPPISYPWNLPIMMDSTATVHPTNQSDDLRKRPMEGAPFPESTKRHHAEDCGDEEEEDNGIGVATDYRPSISMHLKFNDDDGLAPAPVEASQEGIENFRDNDVLSGRGGGTNIHVGNRNFRDLIHFHRRTYLQARKNDKPAISRAVVRAIRESGGRFLKKISPKSPLWYEIGDDAAREKTSQALRQRAPEMRRLLFTAFAECDIDPGECSQQQQKRLMTLMGSRNGMENPMRVWPGQGGVVNVMSPPVGDPTLVPATKVIQKGCHGNENHQDQQVSGMQHSAAAAVIRSTDVL